MIRLFVEPTDVLLFRSGLPFDAGVDSYAAGLFPPSPEPLQGALRAALAQALAPQTPLATLFQQSHPLLGDRALPGRFRMRGPFLARRCPAQPGGIERLYPPPADLVTISREGKETPQLLRPVPPAADPILTAWPPDQPLWRLELPATGGDKLPPFQRWLTPADLARWQTGAPDQIAAIEGVEAKALWQPEPRIGIARDPTTRVVVEGFLYQLEFIRLCEGVGLEIEVWLDPPDPSIDLAALLRERWGRLGGEGRTVRYTVVDAPAGAPSHPAGQRHRLYLTTPALLGGGWQPAGRDWRAVVGADGPIAVTLPGYRTIGGWNLRPASPATAHKPFERHVPAGTVYYFDQPIAWDAQRRLTDDIRKQQIGYGVCITGVW